MAGVIDLGARQREMYMALMGHMFARNQEDDITKELDRQAAEDERARIQKRLEESTAAQITAGQERTRQGAARTGAYVSAEQQREEASRQAILRGQEQSGRAEELLPYRERLMGAQTGAATAAAEASRAAAYERLVTAEKRKLEATGVSEKNAREMAEGLVSDSERNYNFAITQALNGHQFSKEETDLLEHNMQHIGGDRFFKLDRNPDQGWKYDPNTIAQQYPLYDDKGIPSTKLAEGLRKVNMPESDFGRTLKDAQGVLDNPNASEDMRRAATNMLVSKYAPNLGKVQGGLVQRLVDAGAYPQAINLMKDMQGKDGMGAGGQMKPGKPSAASVTDMEDRTSLIQTQNEILDKWKDLRARGIWPTGALRKPIYDTLKEIGANDPDVQLFRGMLQLQISQYMKLMHGRRFMEKEMEFIQNSLPSQYDSGNAFEHVLLGMRQHMIDDVRTRLGVLGMWGIRPSGAEQYEPLDPVAVMKGGQRLPGIEFNDAYISPEQARDTALGFDILRRKGVSIGGMEEFRKNDQLGMTMAPSPSGGPIPTGPSYGKGATTSTPSTAGTEAVGSVPGSMSEAEQRIRQEISNMSSEDLKRALGK
jgi:hypothetical protein